MEVFVAAVNRGSFTAAANAFKITPAMVSKHVNALEKRLGATLLTRTTRRQNLTEVGKKYYENCARILEQVADAETGAEAMGSTPRGLLRVSASMWFGSITLSPVVARFLHRFPDVNVQLSLTDRYVDIVDEGFDVAVRIGDLKDSTLIARKLCMFEVTVCASPAYLSRSGTPKTPHDLLAHECLGFTNWHSQGGWKRMQRQLAYNAARIPRFEADNVQALHAAALEGIGVIMMPKELLKPDIASGRLVELMKSHVPAPRPIYAVYARDRQTVPKVSSFVDFVSDELGRGDLTPARRPRTRAAR